MDVRTPQDAAEAAIDLVDLAERTCDDRELLVELVEIFRSDAPDQMRTLRAALEAGDATVVERRAHHLRGSLCNLAARPAADAALAIETLARAGRLADVTPAVERLEVELARLDEALDRYLGQGR